MLENEEGDGEETCDYNDDEESQISSDALRLFDGDSASGTGGTNGGSCYTVSDQCTTRSYKELAKVDLTAETGQFSCSIFEDKTGIYKASLRNKDLVGDIQQSSSLAGEETRGNCKFALEAREEFRANFKGKSDEDDLQRPANKTSDIAQLKRFKSHSAAPLQQQNDQARQSYQSCPERSLVVCASVGSRHDNPLESNKQQQICSMIPPTATTIETDSLKKNGTTTMSEMASSDNDYTANQNRAQVSLEEFAGHETSLVELSRSTSMATKADGMADDDDGGSRNRGDEQISGQVAATTSDDGDEHADEYRSASSSPGELYDELDCRPSSSLSLASTLSPSNVTTAVFCGQGQLTGLATRRQRLQESKSASTSAGTNQVFVANEEDSLGVAACTKRAIQLEGSVHSGPGLEALRRQPLGRAWQQQQLEPLVVASAAVDAAAPTNASDSQHSSRSTRLLSIAQQRHQLTSCPGDGEQQKRTTLDASANRHSERQQEHASGDGGSERSCASSGNENYENHHILLKQAFERPSSGIADAASLQEDNKEKWYERQPKDAGARSAIVNRTEARDGELHRLAMIDQKKKKETMTENLKQYPPNHPLGNSKHLCAICGDRATGKHYGVFSCEGCKGFFKRTIRKDIVYVCRAQGSCLIDMRQRNRCQYCRYQKCLSCGMKREAVQEEKQRLKLRAAATTGQQPTSDINSNHIFNQCDTSELKLDSTNHYSQYNLGHHEFSANSPSYTSNLGLVNTSHYDRLNAAYHNTGQGLTSLGPSFRGPMRIDELTLKWAAQVQIECLIDWAKSVPRFTGLLIDDQVTLLKAYWNELIIAHIAYKTAEAIRDRTLPNGGSDKLSSLCIGRGLFIDANQAHEIGLGNMFERIIDELVVKMRDMRIDANELACLRAIILFNPETHGLKTSQPIEEYRGDIYTTLEAYCRRSHEDQPNRFGKLLLRLPALRSIGLKCDSMRQQRRCDSNINQVITTSHQGFITRSSPASRGSSSPTNSSVSSISSTSITTTTTTSTTTPAGVNSSYKFGYQVNLLFFGLCYELSSINSFLRSSLSLN